MRGLILVAVGLGGGLGAMARYLIAGWLQSPVWTGFPYGIFVINVTGGFVMGVLVEGMALKFNVTPVTRAFLTTGVLGGYTTFSTFSLEAALLIERHAYGQAMAYIAGSALLSIIALFAGLWLMRSMYA